MSDERYIKVARLDTYYALHGVSAPLTGAPITRANNSGLHHRCAGRGQAIIGERAQLS
jgi:hypothetical protein